jgi:hypothetical protein
VNDRLAGQQSALWVEKPVQDPELEAVGAAILRADPDGNRFAGAIRRSINMLLDGQHTGRYRWDELYKTEKTHAGTLIEINLQREFKFDDGERLDYCKFSQTRGSWMIPPEALGKLLLVVWASDNDSLWCAGLVRAVPELLNRGGNRDSKRTLSSAGRQTVRWLFFDAPLQENMLLRISPEDIGAIFAHKSGQRRVDELFVLAQHRRISRTVVATVAMQEDYMKRVRYNGGSRSRLQPRGIVILGHYSSHGRIAQSLKLPVPQAGDSVSARLVRVRPDHGDAPWVDLEGERWTLAKFVDPEEYVPKLPEV